jgi:hypothetical protein
MTRACFRFLSSRHVVTGLSMGVPWPTPLRAQAQAPERLPSFEVASVKRNTSDDGRTRIQTQPGDRLVFTALQEQLGLKLESAKGQVDVLIIDSVAHPTPD